MRINENFLGKNKTFGFSPSFDTKFFFQEITTYENNTRVKLIHMFNKNEEEEYPIEMEGFSQFIEVDWGDDNLTRLSKDELINSGRYNENGLIIEHTYKVPGTYIVKIESVEDLVVVEYDYDYISNINKTPCEIIKLVTNRIGGMLNTYIPPTRQMINEFENKLDEVSNRCIENKSRILYDDFSLIKNKDTEVKLPSSWCLTVNKFNASMIQELSFKYKLNNNLSCFFSRWNSNMENSNSDSVVLDHFENTIYNIFKHKIYRLDLTGFFAHTKGFYHLTNGGSIDHIISKYIYDLNDYDEVIDDLFISFKYIMWDFYEEDDGVKEWKTFNDDLKYMGLYKLIRKYPNILKGAFGLVRNLPIQKPFNFLMLKSRFDESKINEEYLISNPVGEYSIDLSYMFFCSCYNILAVYDMQSYNIFDNDATSIKINYSKMFAGVGIFKSSKNPIKILLNHDTSELKIISYFPILSLNSCLNGSIKIFNANLTSILYDNQTSLGSTYSIFKFKTYVDINSETNIKCCFFCDNFTINNNNTFQDTEYNIDLSNMFTYQNNGLIRRLILMGEGWTISKFYIFSNNFIKETVEQTSNVILNENYSHMFYSKNLITNDAFHSDKLNIFLFMDYNLKKNIIHRINYSYLFYNNIFSNYGVNNHNSSLCNIIQSIGDRFLDKISEENRNTFDSKYQCEIVADYMLYNCDYDSKEAVLNSLVSETNYNFGEQVIPSYNIISVTRDEENPDASLTFNNKSIEAKGLINKRFYLSEYNGLNSPKIVSAISMCDNDYNNIIKFEDSTSSTNIIFRDRINYVKSSDTHKFNSHLYGSNLFGLVLNERIFNKNNFAENANLTRMFANNIGLDIKYTLPYNDRMCLELDKYNFTEMFAIDDEVGFKIDFENNFKYSEFLKWNDIEDENNVTIKIGAKHAHIFDHMRIFNINNLNINKYTVDRSFNTLQIENMFKGRVLLSNFVKHIMSYNDNYKEDFNFLIEGVDYDFGSYITRTNSKFPTLLVESVDRYVGADLVLDRIKSDNEEKYFDLDLTPGYMLKICNLDGKNYSVNFNDLKKIKGQFYLPAAQVMNYTTYINNTDYKPYLFNEVNNKMISILIESGNLSISSNKMFNYENEDELESQFSTRIEYGELSSDYWYDIIIDLRIYIDQHISKYQPFFSPDYYNTSNNIRPSSAFFGSSNFGKLEKTTDFINNYINYHNYLYLNRVDHERGFYFSSYQMLHLYKFIMNNLNNMNFFDNYWFNLNQQITSDLTSYSDILDLLYNKKIMNSDNLLNLTFYSGTGNRNKIIRDNDFKFTSIFNKVQQMGIGSADLECICGNGLMNYDFLLENNIPLVKTSFLNSIGNTVTVPSNLKIILGSLYEPFGDSIFKENNITNYEFKILTINNLLNYGNDSNYINRSIYIDSKFMNNISNINSHLNIITSLSISFAFKYFNYSNRLFFGNFLDNNIIYYIRQLCYLEKYIDSYIDPYSLDDFYYDDINIYLHGDGLKTLEYVLPKPLNIYGNNVKKINIKSISKNSINYTNIDLYNFWNENIKDNEGISSFGDFSIINNISEKPLRFFGVLGLFNKVNYDVSYEYANQFNSLNNMTYYLPFDSSYEDTIANDYDQLYMNRFIFNRASKTELTEDEFKVIYNENLSYGQIITAFKVNKKCQISYVLNNETIIIDSYEKNTVIELNNLNINFNKLLKSISITNIEDDTPEDLLMIDIRSAFRKNLPLLNYEMFKPRIFVKDNANMIFEMMKIRFKRKEEYSDDEYWHINISKSNLTTNKTNREVTVNRTYQGELLFTDNLYNIKYILEPNYLNNNSLTFSIPKENNEFILYCMNDTPFSCYNSGGSVVSIEGNLGFDILSYIERDENNIFNLSSFMLNLCNSNEIEYIDPNLFKGSNSVLNTQEEFYISFDDFNIKKLNLSLFDKFGNYLSGIYNSFNSNNTIDIIYGRFNNYLNNFKIINSFNCVLGSNGFNTPSPFNRLHLVEINNSFNFKDNSINKIIPHGFLNSKIKNSFSIINSFNNDTIMYRLRDDSINGNKIINVNITGSFNNSIIDIILNKYKDYVLNYLLNYKFKLLTLNDDIISKEATVVKNEIELWKQSISNNYYNKDENINLESNYIQKILYTN